MREAWPVTCTLTRLRASCSVSPPLPPLPSDYCCTSPRAVGKLPLQTFAQQHSNVDGEFTGRRRRLFSTLPLLAHPTVTGIAPAEGGGGCKMYRWVVGVKSVRVPFLRACVFVREWRVCVRLTDAWVWMKSVCTCCHNGVWITGSNCVCVKWDRSERARCRWRDRHHVWGERSQW